MCDECSERMCPHVMYPDQGHPMLYTSMHCLTHANDQAAVESSHMTSYFQNLIFLLQHLFEKAKFSYNCVGCRQSLNILKPKYVIVH